MLLTQSEIDALAQRIIDAERRERIATENHAQEIIEITEKLDAVILDRDKLATGKGNAKLVNAIVVRIDREQPADLVCDITGIRDEWFFRGYQSITIVARIPQGVIIDTSGALILNLEMDQRHEAQDDTYN